MLQEFVNNLFWKGIVPLVGRSQALVWLQKHGIVAKNYQGELFEGNASRELLDLADNLNDKDLCKGIGGYEMTPSIVAFKAMKKVAQSCFSVNKVSSDLDKKN